MRLALTLTAALALLALAGCRSTSVAVTEDPARTTPTTTASSDLVAVGKALAADNGCTGCHTTDGSALVGPTWQGLLGRTELLTSGASVLVDEEYLRQSIVDPDFEVVDGFPSGVMPQDFGDRLTADDITALIEYIRSL